jgi:SAM-dependent methyltransferase
VSSPLVLYAEALRDHVSGIAGPTVIRLHDGTTRRAAVDRWVSGADDVDERVLARLPGPVLDVGCGPGRHLHALARRGVFGLGVDICDVAVDLARGGGANAIVGSIFGDVPGAGRWRSALLLDGNIGIGGRPARLVSRVRELLAPAGTVLVELAGPHSSTVESLARLETASCASDWFPWAEVSCASIETLADEAGVVVSRCWGEGGRWFAVLTVG